jgi:hypothetical protein
VLDLDISYKKRGGKEKQSTIARACTLNQRKGSGGISMQCGKFFPLNATEVNAKGGEGVVKLVHEMLKSMQVQSKFYGTCTLIVYQGNEEKPQKKGVNKKQDKKIETAIKRICTVMQEAVDPERNFDGNIPKIDLWFFYDNVEIRNGIEPGDKDVHCYRIAWYRETGFDLKKRLKKEIEKDPEETVYRAWKISNNCPTPENAASN